MKNFLITGCLGFVGSHLVEELLKDKTIDLIVGIDNFYTGTQQNLDYLENLNKDKKFIFLTSDIRDLDSVNSIVKKYNIKGIFHLAAITSVGITVKDPVMSHNVNVNGTLNILESARLNNVKRVIFSSSAAVYGDEPSLPKNEYSLVEPISPYGYEKLIGEHYMDLYRKLYNIDTISLRYFNIYGERQSINNDYSGVISIFIKKFQQEKAPEIFGDGEQYRDFIYVKDVVKVNIELMNLNEISIKIFCVGTGIKTSINDIFQILNRKFNYNFCPNYLEKRSADIRESLCDNSLLKKSLHIDMFRTLSDYIQKLEI